MYLVHINEKPISEHSNKEDAIYSISERFKLDTVNQIELNTSGMTYLGNAEICLTQIMS